MKKGSITQLFTVLCYAVAVGVEMVLSMVFAGMHSNGQMGDKGYVYTAYLLPQVSYLVVLAVFFAVQRIPINKIFRPEKATLPSYAFMLLIALGLFFVALLPNVFLQKAIQTSGSSSTVLLPPMETAGEIAASILLICVLPAIGEEMMFRKTFCEGMKGNNEWVIILLGGLFFSLTHFNLAQTVHQFVLGCVLCFLYVRTENVTLTMIAHFLNNLLALFIESWTEGVINWNDTTTLAISFAVGAVLLISGVFLVWKKTKKAPGGAEKVSPATIILIALIGVVWIASTVSSYFV